MTKVRFYNKHPNYPKSEEVIPDELIIDFFCARKSVSNDLEIMIAPNCWMTVEPYYAHDEDGDLRNDGYCIIFGGLANYSELNNYCYFVDFEIMDLS